MAKDGVRDRKSGFNSEEAAAFEANKMALKMFGDDVILNDIREEDIPPVPESKKQASSYTGVVWEKRTEKWVAAMKVNKKSEHLGSYETEKEAAIAYNSRLRKALADGHVKSLRKLNDVEEPEDTVVPVTTEGSDQKKKGSSSIYKGVSWAKSNNTWSVEIRGRDGTRVREHRKCEHAAARRYNELAKIHKDNPRLNIIPEDA